jgi:hypothetical protein
VHGPFSSRSSRSRSASTDLGEVGASDVNDEWGGIHHPIIAGHTPHLPGTLVAVTVPPPVGARRAMHGSYRDTAAPQ